jgi:hypothetical protein
VVNLDVMNDQKLTPQEVGKRLSMCHNHISETEEMIYKADGIHALLKDLGIEYDWDWWQKEQRVRS